MTRQWCYPKRITSKTSNQFYPNGEILGAKFNIEKTEIIPLGNELQRNEITLSCKLNQNSDPVPNNIHIARNGKPVRILGAWRGNGVDQATTWTPILENVSKHLKRWGAAKHSLEGRRLIIQIQVAGVTQYLTKVQGVPKDVENDLSTEIRKFMWNYEKTDPITLGAEGVLPSGQIESFFRVIYEITHQLPDG
jgi:hypothetical protein